MPEATPTKVEFWRENTFTANTEGTPTRITNYAFNVEMDDGSKGVYNAKDKNKPKFVVGKPIDYIKEVKKGTKKDGTPYEFTILKAAPKPFGGRGLPKEDLTKIAKGYAAKLGAQYIPHLTKEGVKGEDVLSIRNKFFIFLQQYVSTQGELEHAALCLETAITMDKSGVLSSSIKDSKRIIEFAKYILTK